MAIQANDCGVTVRLRLSFTALVALAVPPRIHHSTGFCWVRPPDLLHGQVRVGVRNGESFLLEVLDVFPARLLSHHSGWGGWTHPLAVFISSNAQTSQRKNLRGLAGVSFLSRM